MIELKTSDIGKTFKYRIRLKMEDPELSQRKTLQGST